MVNVLIVEDEGLVGLNLQKQLTTAGYNVPVVAVSGDEALRVIEDREPDVVLMDIRLQGSRDGIQVAEAIRKTSRVPIIFISALSDKTTLERASRTLPACYMVKPLSFLTLVSSVEMALYQSKTVKVQEASESSQVSQMFESLVKSVKDYAIFMLDPDGIILTWNEGAQRIKGFAAAEIIGRPFSCFYLPEDVQSGHPEEALRIALAEGKFAEEGWRIRRDGSRFMASVIITPVWDQDNRLRGFSKVTHDITERKTAETLLRNSEREFRLLADAIPHIVWISHSDGRNLYHNRRWSEFSGVETADGHWTGLLHPDEVGTARDSWHKSLSSQVPFQGEYRLWDSARHEFRWHLARALPVKNEGGEITRWFGTLTDIHERKTAAEALELEVQKRTADLLASVEQLRAKEETLQQSLVEKEVLLKEIHHRVKNNLQIVSSLLSMQASNIDDESAGAKLRDSERRVMSMALIHEQLYGTKTMSRIDFAEYIRELVPRVFSSFVNGELVRPQLDLQPTIVTIEQAIPCGLILNELVTNALKYAYPAGETGEIAVTLAHVEGDVTLSVSDQGIGLPANFDSEKNRTLGIEIVRILAKQLGGTLDIKTSPGASFTIRFPLETAN